MTADPEPRPPQSSSDSAFHEALAEYLERVERDGSVALEQFRSRHPQFASRLGRQLEWLADHLARRREGVPEQIGPYRVLQRLGQGGMGEVFLAQQTTPFRRAIAIKVIRAGVAHAGRPARFAAEIQALASLNHDGIARLFEAGDDGGRPYFTMEYVPGKPITDYCAEERLDLPARLRLFVAVCRAVEHAHRQGVLHRDIKPSNILVHGPRSEPIVKVIDFGLAKLIVQPAEGPPTETGQLVGTPDYMSPEQVDASSLRVVDTRTDVYSLGVVLYELLTGVLPLSLWHARGHDVAAMLCAIRERLPSSPSVRVGEGTVDVETSPAAGGAVSLHRLSRMLAGDLDAIAMKALAKDAEQRYGGAAALADDVLRHLRHEPVSARPATRRYLLAKFVRRHRAGVLFAATLLLLSFASLITINVIAQRSIHNLERAELFGLVHYLQELRHRDALPPPARPEHLGALEGWLAELDLLLAQRDRMHTFATATPAQPSPRTAADSWASTDGAQGVLRESLQRALAQMQAMSSPGHERDRMLARIDWARRVVEATVTSQGAAWARVRDELRADSRFAGVDLRPQVGLVPLGRDPASGLQEFALPLPGCVIPRRTELGLQVTAHTCPVFVLVPGGEVTIGSQADDEHAPRFDPARRPFERDVQTVELEPFFAGKYELTNAQWQPIDPGDHGSDPVDVLFEPTHPLVEIDSDWLLHVIHAWGMRLPTDHEWEHLARGGTDTAFASGADWRTLQTCANVHDRAVTERDDVKGEDDAVPWSDGHAVTAPVGSFAANGYGLFDVHGNAAEVAVRTVPGREPQLELRGGSWHQGAAAARCTSRTFWDGRPLMSIGCRPVISLVR